MSVITTQQTVAALDPIYRFVSMLCHVLSFWIHITTPEHNIRACHRHDRSSQHDKMVQIP